MAMIESWFKQDLKEPVHVQMIKGNVFSQDEQANLIGVTVTDGGETAALSGTVAASIIRADGATVAQAGTLSGNRCFVILPAAAYAVPGPLVIALKLTQSGVVTTVLAVAATVYRTSTDSVVDPGTIIPSIQDLIDEIEEAVATIPADYSALSNAVMNKGMLFNPIIEQGGFTNDGLNPGFVNNTRVRSKEYIRVMPGKKYRLGLTQPGGYELQGSVSIYAQNDYTTPRITYTDFTKNTFFSVPDNANYIRLLFKKTNDANITPAEVPFCFIQLIENTSSLVMSIDPHLHTNCVDCDNWTDPGIYSFYGEPVLHAPFPNKQYAFVLEVYGLTNGVILQRLTYITGTQGTYVRFRLVDTTWQQWVNAPGVCEYVTDIIDFDNYRTNGEYLIASGNHAHRPTVEQSACFLHVSEATNGAILQRACFPFLGYEFHRGRGLNNVWTNWTCVNAYYVAWSFPVMARMNFQTIIDRVESGGVMQDIAVYNGTIVELDAEKMWINGGSEIAITNGHGNNAMFGTTLHGTYPYLYCGSWNKNTCEVYVNQITDNSATLVRTISFTGLSGYLNMCVDEPNSKIYILLCTSETTEEGEVDFIVADLQSGEIISRKTLQYPLPIIQGMEYHNGYIYVTYGDGTAATPNTIAIIDNSGDMISKTEAVNIGAEIEGISFSNGTMYVASSKKIMMC